MSDAATPANPAPDDAIPGQQPADGQGASWLKSLLPEPQSGWWEVSVKGKGFAVKFRWRDTDLCTALGLVHKWGDRPDFSGDFHPASREIKQERRST